ncbi:MAG: hypothetical protein ABI112_07120 [Terracoccus sp.]
MTWVEAAATPWWFVALVALAGAAVGLVLTPRLASGGYRLDDEAGPMPFPSWVVMPMTALAWGVLAWRLGALGDYTVLPALLTFSTVGVALCGSTPTYIGSRRGWCGRRPCWSRLSSRSRRR